MAPTSQELGVEDPELEFPRWREEREMGAAG
jgi:hypothetical protein